MDRAAVVGAGMGGLAAAARLATRGWKVTVFDSQSSPGGKNAQETWEGFRFDTGPSLLTMVPVFRDLFASCGRRLEDFVTPVPLDPLCHYWWDDGSSTRVPGSVSGFIDHFSTLGWASKEALKAFFRRAERLHGIGGTLFLEKSLHQASTYFSPEGLKSILGLPFIDPFRTLHQAHGASFSDPRLVQLFDRYATYNGSDPFQAPATLDIIPWVEYAGGGWGVREGIHALARAMEKLCLDLGVEFRYGEKVDAILSKDGQIRGVEVREEFLPFGTVISNADVLNTYTLLGDEEAPWAKKYRKLEPSSSGFVFYWGMNRSFPDLGVHNIFFSGDYEKEFRQIFREKVLPEDPTVYINITSKITPEDAPPGGENWFILVNTPPHQGQDWSAQGKVLRTSILARLEKALGLPLESHIALERTLTPGDIESRTGSTYGSLYGLSSNTWNAAFARHPNRSTRHKGLYFTGGSAHPGGGMPLVILSGKIVGELVEKYQGRKKGRTK